MIIILINLSNKTVARNPKVIWEEATSSECNLGICIVLGEKYKTIMQ